MYFPTAIENGTGKNHVKSHMHRRKKNIHDFDNNIDVFLIHGFKALDYKNEKLNAFQKFRRPLSDSESNVVYLTLVLIPHLILVLNPYFSPWF